MAGCEKGRKPCQGQKTLAQPALPFLISRRNKQNEAASESNALMDELTAAVSGLRSGPRLRHALAQVTDAEVRDQLAAAVVAVVAEAISTADKGEQLFAGQKRSGKAVPLTLLVCSCWPAWASQR